MKTILTTFSLMGILVMAESAWACPSVDTDFMQDCNDNRYLAVEHYKESVRTQYLNEFILNGCDRVIDFSTGKLKTQ